MYIHDIIVMSVTCVFKTPCNITSHYVCSLTSYNKSILSRKIYFKLVLMEMLTILEKMMSETSCDLFSSLP